MDQLLLRAKQGDEEAIEQLFADYKGLIRSYANRFYIVGGDKDDLLQEGMLGLVNAINRYEENKGPFPNFVKLCVLRQILNAVRHDNGMRQQPLANYVNLDEITDLVDPNGPLENLLHKELLENLLFAAANCLSPFEREVFSLFWEGHSYDEIAQKTGKSPKAVDGALQRARKKLSEHTN